MRKSICIIIVCTLIITLFSGCNLLQKLGLKKADNDELRPVSSIVMGEEEAKKLSDKIQVRLYFDNGESTKLGLEIRYIEKSEAEKSVNNLASVIVKELINGPGSKSSLKATIPEGTQLHSPIKIEAGVATVDFSKEFKDKHAGGKAAERMTIYSVVNTLTELKEIQKVQFLIEGKTVKEYKGSFKFDVPFPRTTSLISDEPTEVLPDNKDGIEDKDTGDPKKQDGVENKDTGDPKKQDGDKSKETSGDIDSEGIIEETFMGDVEVDENGEYLE